MSQQARLDLNNTSFIQGGTGVVKNGETLLTDGGRAIPLAQYISINGNNLTFNKKPPEGGFGL